MKQVFENKGLDDMFNNPDNVSVPTFKKCTSECYQNHFYQDIMSYTSLQLYRMVKQDTSCAHYIISDKCSFRAMQLKFKLRTGVLGLGSDLHRQHRGSGLCNICGVFESAKHFIFQCPSYNPYRFNMLNSIRNCVSEDYFNVFIQDMDFALWVVLGNHDDINLHFGAFLEKAWKVRSTLQ